MKEDKQKAQFFDKLRGMCATSGKSREEIATFAGITKQTLWSYTSGKKSPNTNVLAKLCQACNFDIKNLFE